jgi:hypothetical protein
MMTLRQVAAYGQVMDIAWHARAWPALARQLRGRVRATDAVLAVGLILAFSEPGLDSYHHDSVSQESLTNVLRHSAARPARAGRRARRHVPCRAAR